MVSGIGELNRSRPATRPVVNGLPVGQRPRLPPASATSTVTGRSRTSSNTGHGTYCTGRGGEIEPFRYGNVSRKVMSTLPLVRVTRSTSSLAVTASRSVQTCSSSSERNSHNFLGKFLVNMGRPFRRIRCRYQRTPLVIGSDRKSARKLAETASSSVGPWSHLI
jgi:hypothetical protein